MPVHMPYCKYLQQGHCRWGCHEPATGPAVLFCHNFARRGYCDGRFYLHSIPDGMPKPKRKRNRFTRKTTISSDSDVPIETACNPKLTRDIAEALELLGLNKDGVNVNARLIKAAHKCHSLAYHPDKAALANASDEEKVAMLEHQKLLNNALDTLLLYWE